MPYNVEEVDAEGRKSLGTFTQLADALVFANQLKRVSKKKIQVTSGNISPQYSYDKEPKVIFG